MTTPTPEEVAAIARRLTKAQRIELLVFHGDEPKTCCLHYRPFLKLWDLELVTRGNPRWLGDYFVLTDLGRAVAAILRAGAKP